MAAQQSSTQELLLVLFSRRPLTALVEAAQSVPAVRVAETHDCYAAAADVLVSPQSVLIADITALTRDQAGLLTMAQRLGVPVYTYGQATRRIPELAGLPTVSAADIPGILSGFLSDDLAGQRQNPAADSLEQATMADQTQQLDEPPSPPPMEMPVPPPAEPLADRPVDVLSPEEIAALLDGRI